MAVFKGLTTLMCLFAAALSIQLISPFVSACDSQSNTFLFDLQFQCPISISRSSASEVDGDFFERALSSSQKNEYTAVLFYASWCPFSRDVRSKFDMLSSIFPQIRHFAIEQSSALPSLFSRYGIHSLPSILIVNQTTKVRYRGRKDLRFLVDFYERTTGIESLGDPSNDKAGISGSEEIFFSGNELPLKDIFKREPYLVLSVIFLFLRAFLYFFPEILSRISSLWISYAPNLNLGIIGESSQLLGHILHLVNLKRLWNKLKLCKGWNFQSGARRARLWASSLASVSLGETSSSRAASSG